METLEKKDLLKMNDDTFVRSILGPKEEIYLSCSISKYNRYGFKQERVLLITNLHLFNLSKQKINRKIDLFKVDGFTISAVPTSAEFIIHVAGEYDYRYLSPTIRDFIAVSIRKILKNKGHSIIFYKVPQVKLKQYATIKKEVPRGIFRRPGKEYIVPEEEITQEIKPKVVLEKKKGSAEEVKEQQEVSSSSQEQISQEAQYYQNQTQVQQVQQQEQKQEFQTQQMISMDSSQPHKASVRGQEIKQQQQFPKPYSGKIVQEFEAKTYQKLTTLNLDQVKEVKESEPEFIPDIGESYKIAKYKGKTVVVSEISDKGPNILTSYSIDQLNKSEYTVKVDAIVLQQDQNLKSFIFEKPPESFKLLSNMIAERQSQLMNEEELEPINCQKLAKIFMNIAKAVADLESKGIEIQVLHPQNILVNEESGIIKLLMSQSTIQKIEKSSHMNFSYMPQSTEEIRYQSPEIIEHQFRTLTSCSWSIGVIMYEYVYGINPFVNPQAFNQNFSSQLSRLQHDKSPSQGSGDRTKAKSMVSDQAQARKYQFMDEMSEQTYRLMKILITRYPVVFKDTPNMPHEFQEVLRDLLAKDYTQRLGSENFIQEYNTQPFFATYLK